jgi:two-component system sensor histidine kinase UhpB
MKDQSKTKQALVQELASLRERITELEQSESVRKRVDDMLCLHSEILVHMVESVHLVRVDDGVIVYTNQRFESVFGYDPGELVGKHVSIVNAPGEKSSEAVANEIIRSLKQAGVWNGEVHNIRKDGSSFWCYANVSTFKHPQYGEVWISVNRDITERKQAEEMLHRAEENFRRSLEDSPLGVRIVTIEGETIYANRAILDIYSLDELKATPPIKCYTPECYAEFQIRREKRKRDDNAPSEYEIRIIGKDGKIRHLQVFRKEILWDGERQFQVIYQDITDRKQVVEVLRESEERYRAIIENMEDGYHEVDIKGNFTFFNESMCKIMGYEREELLGMNNRQYADEENTRKVYQIYNRVYRTGEPVKNFEWQIIRKDGARRDIEVSISLIRDMEAHPIGFRGIVRDTTDRKKAEEELRTSRLQLRALAMRLQQIREEERIMIAREIHDEMGGGLTGLKMDLSWLLRKMGDADPGEARVALMDKIHTSNALIDQMIHVVRRISADLRPSVLDDLGLVAALSWQAQEFTSRTEIQCEFVTSLDYVNLDDETATGVFRVFQEALTNVMRHSGATKVAVVLQEGERSLFGDESLVLEIRDNGRGITEEEILNPESLGLLGMKERVLAFGGELSIRGDPDGGTTLIIKIPRIQGEPS